MTDTNSLDRAPIAGLLSGLPVALRGEAQGLGRAGLAWHPAPGEWCVNEVVGHLMEAERRGFAGRIRQIIERPGRALETWDQEQVARERRDCERDGLELIAELVSLRTEGDALVRGLRPEQLELSGEHPQIGTMQIGSLRVVDLLHEWVHHDREHLKQVLSNVQAYVWPHMGNARRFSEID